MNLSDEPGRSLGRAKIRWTASAFFGVGAAKGAVLHRSALRSGLETLLTGGEAALLAYVVGAWLRAAFGAS